MSIDPSSEQGFLTIDYIRRLKDERDEAMREYEAVGRRLELLNKKVEAAALFVPEHMHSRVFGEDRPDENRRRKWAPTIFRLLEDAGHGLTTADIKERLKGTDLEHEIGPSGNSLYNGLSKIVAKGELIKEGHYYCLPGQKPPAQSSAKIPASQIEIDVLSVLTAHPGGLRSMEIVQAIFQADLPSGGGMRKSTGGFYKALSLLVAAGKVNKDGRLYTAPSKENEPHGAGAPNGSDAGSHEAPNKGFFG